jgi:toxin ParE1/3/4
MAHEVVWSPRAVEDVRAIATHIAEDSVAYAKSVAQKVVASTRKLAAAAVIHGKRPLELEIQP